MDRRLGLLMIVTALTLSTGGRLLAALSAADGAPWGLESAPRMPYDLETITIILSQMPDPLARLTRSADVVAVTHLPLMRYLDADGQAVALLYPVPFQLLQTAPAFVRSTASTLAVVAATSAADLSETARIVYLAGGVVGADPPLHALIWAYSDRGFGFVLLATSPEVRAEVVQALVATLRAFDTTSPLSESLPDARPTCPTNAAGDNLKC